MKKSNQIFRLTYDDLYEYGKQIYSRALQNAVKIVNESTKKTSTTPIQTRTAAKPRTKIASTNDTLLNKINDNTKKLLLQSQTAQIKSLKTNIAKVFKRFLNESWDPQCDARNNSKFVKRCEKLGQHDPIYVGIDKIVNDASISKNNNCACDGDRCAPMRLRGIKKTISNNPDCNADKPCYIVYINGGTTDTAPIDAEKLLARVQRIYNVIQATAKKYTNVWFDDWIGALDDNNWDFRYCVQPDTMLTEADDDAEDDDKNDDNNVEDNDISDVNDEENADDDANIDDEEDVDIKPIPNAEVIQLRGSYVVGFMQPEPTNDKKPPRMPSASIGELFNTGKLDNISGAKLKQIATLLKYDLQRGVKNIVVMTVNTTLANHPIRHLKFDNIKKCWMSGDAYDDPQKQIEIYKKLLKTTYWTKTILPQLKNRLEQSKNMLAFIKEKYLTTGKLIDVDGNLFDDTLFDQVDALLNDDTVITAVATDTFFDPTDNAEIDEQPDVSGNPGTDVDDNNNELENAENIEADNGEEDANDEANNDNEENNNEENSDNEQ